MILVTGASGFIGANLCARLVADGVRFRALVRSREKARKRGIPDEAIVVGDLFANLDSVVVGVSAVVHLAGLVRASSAKELERVNAMGTANLMRALAELAPEARTVVVSSLAAAGPSADGSGTAVAPEAAHPVSAYGRSKRAAELELRAARNPWLVLRPGIVYGPWDRDVLHLFRSVAGGWGFLGRDEASYSMAFVGDVVDALMAALDADCCELYLPVVHPEPIADEAWLRALAVAVGAKVRVLRVPRAVLRIAAELGDILTELRGVSTPLSLDKFTEMCAGSWIADAEPAKQAIGFEAKTSAADGFSRTAAWYRGQGWL